VPVLIALVAAAVIAVIAAALAYRAAFTEAQRQATTILDAAHAETAAELAAAKLAASALVQSAETEARAEALAVRTTADETVAREEAAVAARESKLGADEVRVATRLETLDARADQLDAIHKDVQARRDRASGLERDISQKSAAVRTSLEQRAGVGASELIARLGQAWIDEARARAAALVRNVDQTAADPAHDRTAKRVMEIAATRYHHHYLTERNPSNLRVGKDLIALMLDNDAALHLALQKVAGVQLLISDDKDAFRMDGLDGVGKEFVRRAMARLMKKPESVAQAKEDPEAWALRGRGNLDLEIKTLGKKAFQILGIGKAHPEIVELVGALNFRTSYTQNQWWHAVEASYLAGMMAEELGLDAKLARRATLMHDIGKALTHKIEGSHAVIGADIARRVGEAEIVANAIGAHHADEPCNSVYAYLVAASDAMSGARPGARRELAEGFTAKVEDLERIGAQRRGVDYAHAVHGGRELRVYVREREVDDATVVEMSGEIAAQISEEMTFPGQIKVTVIRAFEATSTAN